MTGLLSSKASSAICRFSDYRNSDKKFFCFCYLSWAFGYMFWGENPVWSIPGSFFLVYPPNGRSFIKRISLIIKKSSLNYSVHNLRLHPVGQLEIPLNSTPGFNFSQWPHEGVFCCSRPGEFQCLRTQGNCPTIIFPFSRNLRAKVLELYPGRIPKNGVYFQSVALLTLTRFF